METLQREQRTETLRREYLAAQANARARNQIQFGIGYDATSHNLIAEAVAASMTEFYQKRPRVWLAKYGQAAICASSVPTGAKTLYQDFRETVKEFEDMIGPKVRYTRVDGDDLRYSVTLSNITLR